MNYSKRNIIPHQYRLYLLIRLFNVSYTRSDHAIQIHDAIR